MNGTIYNKKTKETPQQQTGDNCLILGPRTSYQAPFAFGNDWEVIRLGVIWSCSSTTGLNTNDDTLYNTPITDPTNGQGTVTFENANENLDQPRNNSWYGVIQNNGLNTFPNHNGTSLFIGYRGYQMNFSSNETDAGVLRKGNHLAGGVLGEARLEFIERTRVTLRTQIEDSSALTSPQVYGLYSNNGIGPKIYGLNNTNPSGIDPSKSGNFASFWGLQIEKKVVNGLSPSGRWQYSAVPFYYNPLFESFENGGGNHQYSSGCKITDCGSNSLLNILDGNGLQSGLYPTPRYRSSDRTPFQSYSRSQEDLDFLNETYTPNALFFYNSFTGLNMRIHSHAVVKVK